MGLFVNPLNVNFARSLRSQIYVDQSGLISYTNKMLMTQQSYICVSRPRRFGKSMAASMLSAYYSCGCNSESMFENLKISHDFSYKEHLNKYNVIYLNMQDFLSQSDSMKEMINDINKCISNDIVGIYPELNKYVSENRYTDILESLYMYSQTPIVFIIDEWDCIFREYKLDVSSPKMYLDFLRTLLKDKQYVALAYMTGILPIKKYGSHSALNMFREFSMTNPGELAGFVGFTQDEVISLCDRYRMDYDEISGWYNGYSFPGIKAVYNPKSVVEAMLSGRCDDYWSQTETFEALSIYFKMNYDGLKDTVIELLSGLRKQNNISNFSNDMVTFKTYEDILTLLIHLGYLGYDLEAREVFIPNKEIRDEFVTAIRDTDWNELIGALRVSDSLLKAVWQGDSEAVAQMIENSHYETSIIKYNDENALACVISLAFYSARQYYVINREIPAGKGFADMSFLPRKKYPDKPAMIVELKWGRSALEAVRQIESRKYTDILKDYKDNALLVGINYDKVTKLHECIIKKLVS